MLRDTTTRIALLFLGIGSLMVGSHLKAGEVKWNKDIKQAARRAVQEKKPLMVMVSAPWCGYCQQMLKTTFQDQELVEHINHGFVPVYLNADEHEEIVEELQVKGLPTTLIISPEMQVVERFSGFKSAKQLTGPIIKLCNHTNVIRPAKLARQKPAPAPMFEGTCLVSLRDGGKLVKGNGQWWSRHKGHVVYFASEEHKLQFDAKPETYWPVADGVCLVSQEKERTARPGAPVLAMIYADHVWFFADEAHQAEFVKNPKPYLNLLKTAK